MADVTITLPESDIEKILFAVAMINEPSFDSLYRDVQGMWAQQRGNE